MKIVRERRILRSRVVAFPMILGVLALLAGCVSAPDHPDWIRVGVTTQNEVIQRYGQPDLVIALPRGETAVYRPSASGQSIPRLEIPTAQAGPFGTTTTRMQSIDPGSGAKDLNTKTEKPLRREIRILYDDRGIVQELASQ